MLWSAGYHDGPLDGLTLYNGQKVLFSDNTPILLFVILKILN